MKRYRGVLALVAKQLRVRPATVANVWACRAASAKITAALIAEFNRRIEAEINAQMAESDVAA